MDLEYHRGRVLVMEVNHPNLDNLCFKPLNGQIDCLSDTLLLYLPLVNKHSVNSSCSVRERYGYFLFTFSNLLHLVSVFFDVGETPKVMGKKLFGFPNRNM